MVRYVFPKCRGLRLGPGRPAFPNCVARQRSPRRWHPGLHSRPNVSGVTHPAINRLGVRRRAELTRPPIRARTAGSPAPWRQGRIYRPECQIRDHRPAHSPRWRRRAHVVFKALERLPGPMLLSFAKPSISAVAGHGMWVGEARASLCRATPFASLA